MSLSAREQRALDRIADELAGPDSNLAVMLDTFTRLTAGERMPQGEEIRPSPRLTRRVPTRGPRPRLLCKCLSERTRAVMCQPGTRTRRFLYRTTIFK